MLYLYYVEEHAVWFIGRPIGGKYTIFRFD